MKQRAYVNFIISLLVLILIVNLVSARSVTEDLKNMGNGVFELVKPIFAALLGDLPGEQYLFAKVLFFLIIVSIIWIALSKIDFFSEYPAVLWIISLAASILAVRWTGGKAVIDTIILPYSALGIAISAGLPFVLFFIIINIGLNDPTNPQKYRFVRRISWVLFAVVFIGLWLSRDASLLTAEGSYAGYIYPVVAALALIIAFMDGTISRFFLEMHLNKIGAVTKQDAITEYTRKLNDLSNLFANNIISAAEMQKRQREYRKKIASLSK